MNNEEKILAILKQHGETLSELQKTVTRVAVTQENIVIPQIKLLAEGHDILLNTLARAGEGTITKQIEPE